MVRQWLVRVVTAGQVLGLVGCGYHHYASPLRPLAEQVPGTVVAEDGGVVYEIEGLTVQVRALTDEDLNGLFLSHSNDGPQSTNPYTHGDTEFWPGPRTRQRFTVFSLQLENHGHPKVKLDPAQAVLRTADGQEYWSLGLQQLETYYRAYLAGYQGNAYLRYRERQDLLRRTLYKNEEAFVGQTKEGYVVFPVVAPEVTRVSLEFGDVVLRFDPHNQPVEAAHLVFGFRRDVGRVYADGRVVLQGVD